MVRKWTFAKWVTKEGLYFRRNGKGQTNLPSNKTVRGVIGTGM
jgi:hypothetical protein